jgi:hypothetical protein
VRIDFAEFRSEVTTEYQATPGGDVTSKGFDFYAAFGDGARNALGTWGTDDGELSQNLPTNLGPTAAALWGTRFGERIDMETESGLRFDLYAMDVAHLTAASTAERRPVADHAVLLRRPERHGGLGDHVVHHPAPARGGRRAAAGAHDLAFGDAWRNLSSVRWFQGSGAQGGTRVGVLAPVHERRRRCRARAPARTRCSAWGWPGCSWSRAVAVRPDGEPGARAARAPDPGARTREAAASPAGRAARPALSRRATRRVSVRTAPATRARAPRPPATSSPWSPCTPRRARSR